MNLVATFTGNQSLTFKLKNSPIAKKIAMLIRQCNRAGYKPGYVSMGLFHTEDDLKYATNVLKDCIRQHNADDDVKQRICFDESHCCNICTDTLNALHDIYEQNMSQHEGANKLTIADNYKPTRQYSANLNRINNTIHQLEKCIYSIENNYHEGTMSACLVSDEGDTGRRFFKASKSEYIGNKLTEEDRQGFTLGRDFGSLHVGYSTTGKNLIQCYWSNDLKLVKDRKLAPQQIFNTNISINFPLKKCHHDDEYGWFKEWYDKNDISQYGYTADVGIEGIGYINIGELVMHNDVPVDVSSMNIEQRLSITNDIKKCTLIGYDVDIDGQAECRLIQFEKIDRKYNTEFTNRLNKHKHIFTEIYNECGSTFIKKCGSYLFDGLKYEYCDQMYEKQQLLYNVARNANNVLEIGTYMGHSLLIMLLANPNLKITCIDVQDQYTAPAVKILNKHFNNAIHFIHGDSLTELAKLKTKFDFFHIDGRHRNDYITKEFNLIYNLNSSSKTLKVMFDDESCLRTLQRHIRDEYSLVADVLPGCSWSNVYFEILIDNKVDVFFRHLDEEYFTQRRDGGKDMITSKDYDVHVLDSMQQVEDQLRIQKNDTVLDIGSGFGDVAGNISKKYDSEVYCCDVNSYLLSKAKQNCPKGSNMHFNLVEDDKQPLSFLKDNSINKAYAYAVFHHNETPTVVNYLKDIKRVLKVGGQFMFNYCNKKLTKRVARNIFEVDKIEIDEAISKLGFKFLKNATSVNSLEDQLHAPQDLWQSVITMVIIEK